MLVLDRTGSMCQDHNGNTQSACTDLTNARNGMKTFLRLLNPDADWVGLAVLPPATSTSNKCTTPQTANYDSTSAAYTIVPLSHDYSTNGVLNTGSNLVSTINCQKANGETSYATAIEKAQAELDAHGRANVSKVIVFFSDGAANSGPGYHSTSSPYRKKPCHQGVSSAGTVKGRGHDHLLDRLRPGRRQRRREQVPLALVIGPAGAARRSPRTRRSSRSPRLRTAFYNQPTAGQLNTLFSAGRHGHPARRVRPDRQRHALNRCGGGGQRGGTAGGPQRTLARLGRSASAGVQLERPCFSRYRWWYSSAT